MQILETAIDISSNQPTDQDKAFLARQLVQTTFPHKDPGNVPVWSRGSGKLILTIQQGYDKKGEPFGHPFGTIPRLLMYWMNTEAVRNKDRKIQLGVNLADFMQEIGLNHRNGGGKRSDAFRLKEQMNRLFEASISFTSYQKVGNKVSESRDRMLVTDHTTMWWDTKNPEQNPLWESFIVLSHGFFEMMTANPVPVDIRAIRAIKRSPLALDLYALLTYQSFLAQKHGVPRFMDWEQLREALGTGYSDNHDLRKYVKQSLLMIQTVYPKLKVGDRTGGIEIMPESLPAIEVR